MKICDKIAMPIKDAALYSGIGENKLRDIITNDKSIDWVLYVGKNIRVKRIPFERWFLAQSMI